MKLLKEVRVSDIKISNTLEIYVEALMLEVLLFNCIKFRQKLIYYATITPIHFC